MTKEFEMFVGGKSIQGQAGIYFDSIDPSNGEVYAKVARGNADDVDVAVKSAHEAFASWARMRPKDRGTILKDVAAALLENKAYLAEIETREMGMPTQMSPMTIDGAVEYFDFYGGLAPSLTGATIPVEEDFVAWSTYEPFGVVASITPWNGPVNQAARSLAPALAVGNTVVLKPSEYTSIASIEMARIAHEAGLPEGVLNVVTGFGQEVGAALCEHSLVEKIAFTGSVNTGRAIGKAAADRVVPVTLELGGKSPNIVFEDAKLDIAVPQVLFGFILNSGQVCTSGTRIIVQRSIIDEFSKKLVAAAESIPLGVDKPFPCLGPIANQMQFDKVISYLESAKDQGADCLTGGERATGDGLDNGLYIKPTIYSGVTPEMRIVREEIFGPVGVLIPFDTEEEAIAIANDTDLGLASGVWTQDTSRVHRVVRALQAGTVYVNAWHAQKVEVAMGGFKRSGIGRERGLEALKDYVQTKNVTQKLI